MGIINYLIVNTEPIELQKKKLVVPVPFAPRFIQKLV